MGECLFRRKVRRLPLRFGAIPSLYDAVNRYQYRTTLQKYNFFLNYGQNMQKNIDMTEQTPTTVHRKKELDDDIYSRILTAQRQLNADSHADVGYFLPGIQSYWILFVFLQHENMKCYGIYYHY